MNKTRFTISKPDIIAAFDVNKHSVFKKADIEVILNENREFWRLTQGTTTLKFINFLLEHASLKRINFKFPHRNEVIYTWGERSIYEAAKILRPESYFSHYTSMYFNELTEQLPKTIFVNYEQSKKIIKSGTLAQDRIDNAFRGRVRTSNTIAEVGDYKICLLNGKYTNKLGVIEYRGSQNELLYITNIERTLIDITVRPVYSGGVSEVLRAYKFAKGKVSINKLCSMLQQINYIYPYHQAIGFYLERSGVYSKSQIELLRKFDIKYKFYLAHDMGDTDYSEEWKLYYPKGF